MSHPRGGYCFEVNGLLLDALTNLGFQAEPKLARVHLGDTPSGRSHQVTLVTIDEERWIVDVGFGSHTPRAPIKVVVDVEQHADFQLFRFVEVEDYGYLLQRRNEDGWMDLYTSIWHLLGREISSMPTTTHPQARIPSLLNLSPQLWRLKKAA